MVVSVCYWMLMTYLHIVSMVVYESVSITVNKCQ